MLKRYGQNLEQSFYKLNVDAAFSAKEKAGASGVVLRNSQGIFMAGSSTYLPHVSLAAMAEALAMLHGLKLARL